ncbi:hypothetical protein BHE74_00011058 [Ensete ventricosum]|nr:hypothetical protein BHE74_00011058 [Ensete ventricosum]
MVGRPNPFTFVWVDGPLKYLEVVGNYISLSDPNSTKDVYAQLLDIHLRAIGKCISLQGKSATLSSHETGSNTKMLQRETHVSVHKKQSHVGEYSINEFKSQLRLSFRKFIGRPVKLQLRTAVQAIERALIGTPQGCHMVYEVRTGDFNGGTVSPNVAGGIDCLDLVLEYVSDKNLIVLPKVCRIGLYRRIEFSSIWYGTPVPMRDESRGILRPPATDSTGEGRSRFFFSLFFLTPSVDIARNRSPTVEIDCYRSILSGNEAAPIGDTAR